MTQTIYQNLTAKQKKSLEDYCFWLDMDRYKKTGELPKSTTNTGHVFVQGMEGTGARGLRLS